MVEVTEMFYGKGFALDKVENAKGLVAKVKGIKGWNGEVKKDKRCFRTYFTFKMTFNSKEDYERNFTVMNNDFVGGLASLGYTVDNFDESNVKVSVLEYKEPTTFRDWQTNKK